MSTILFYVNYIFFNISIINIIIIIVNVTK